MLHISGSVDCPSFREWVYHLQAEELVEADRQKLLDHAHACARCAAYLEFEDSLFRGLKRRLPVEQAPQGLEGRIRTALQREIRGRATVPRAWYRGPAVSGLAAALLLVALLVPTLAGRYGRSAPGSSQPIRVSRAVTVVDGDCDAAGRTPAEQAACRNHLHVNVLKIADGQYWTVNLGRRPGVRELVLDPTQRGRRLVVEADYYPELDTVELLRVRDAHNSQL